MPRVEALTCPQCGAPLKWDGRYDTALICPYCGAEVRPAATAMEDVWMMTDPVARARYEADGTLDKLEHDIRYEVMRGQDWSAEDRQYAAEIERLTKEGSVRRLATFWSVSPHPSVYRALKSGAIRFGAGSAGFQAGDDLVWACPMTRDSLGLGLPVLVGDLQDARVQRLCGKMANAMMARMS